MTNYEGSMKGADNVRKGGATQGGTVAPVVGSPNATVAKGGATNNGR